VAGLHVDLRCRLSEAIASGHCEQSIYGCRDVTTHAACGMCASILEPPWTHSVDADALGVSLPPRSTDASQEPPKNVVIVPEVSTTRMRPFPRSAM
jgi:hypothetical protein